MIMPACKYDTEAPFRWRPFLICTALFSGAVGVVGYAMSKNAIVSLKAASVVWMGAGLILALSIVPAVATIPLLLLTARWSSKKKDSDGTPE